MGETTAALVLLLAVLCVAAFATRIVAVAASLVAFVCFNLFFLQPVGSLAIASTRDVIALFTLLAVSLIGSDLSQRARRSAEQAVKSARREQEAEIARRSAEAKSALVASFSHDLKTPLTALTVAAGNVAVSGLSESERREQIAIVQTEVDRLKRLFDNLMSLASVDAHAVQPEREWVHPIDIVDAARQQVRGRSASHPVEIVDACSPSMFNLDPRLASAALAHVIENAATYSPPAAPIHIDLYRDGEGLAISVRDHGDGLGEGEPDRVFDRFFRGAAGMTDRFSSGMGLSISKGLLATQHGTITAANHPQGGAIFRLSIPAPSRTAELEEAAE